MCTFQYLSSILFFNILLISSCFGKTLLHQIACIELDFLVLKVPGRMTYQIFDTFLK